MCRSGRSSVKPHESETENAGSVKSHIIFSRGTLKYDMLLLSIVQVARTPVRTVARPGPNVNHA